MEQPSATTGNSAQTAAPGSTNRKTRSSIRRTAGELRTYRPPARRALANRSGGRAGAAEGRRVRSNTTMKTSADTAVTAKTAAGTDLRQQHPGQRRPDGAGPVDGHATERGDHPHLLAGHELLHQDLVGGQHWRSGRPRAGT